MDKKELLGIIFLIVISFTPLIFGYLDQRTEEYVGIENLSDGFTYLRLSNNGAGLIRTNNTSLTELNTPYLNLPLTLASNINDYFQTRTLGWNAIKLLGLLFVLFCLWFYHNKNFWKITATVLFGSITWCLYYLIPTYQWSGIEWQKIYNIFGGLHHPLSLFAIAFCILWLYNEENKKNKWLRVACIYGMALSDPILSLPIIILSLIGENKIFTFACITPIIAGGLWSILNNQIIALTYFTVHREIPLIAFITYFFPIWLIIFFYGKTRQNNEIGKMILMGCLLSIVIPYGVKFITIISLGTNILLVDALYKQNRLLPIIFTLILLMGTGFVLIEKVKDSTLPKNYISKEMLSSIQSISLEPDVNCDLYTCRWISIYRHNGITGIDKYTSQKTKNKINQYIVCNSRGCYNEK